MHRYLEEIPVAKATGGEGVSWTEGDAEAHLLTTITDTVTDAEARKRGECEAWARKRG